MPELPAPEDELLPDLPRGIGPLDVKRQALALAEAANTAVLALQARMRSELLAADDAEVITAAGPLDPATLDQLPQWWVEELQASLDAPIADLFTATLQATILNAVGPIELDVAAIADQYLATVNNRLTFAGEDIFTQVRRELIEGLSLNESPVLLRQRLSSYIGPDGAWEWRAARIARTEIQGAIQMGHIGGAQVLSRELDVGYEKVWIATFDARTRHTHILAHGQRVPLDQPFTVGGWSLLAPGDPNGPPEEIIQCRCTVITEPIDQDPIIVPPAPPELVAQAEAALTAAATKESVMPKNRWSGVIAVEGTPTGDGRMIEAGAATWPDLPIPLRLVLSDVGGHDGAQTVGLIETITRDGAELRATGSFDLGSDIGREAARQVSEGLTTGVSIDPDDIAFEVRLAKEVLDAFEEMVEGESENERKEDSDGRVTVYEGAADDELFVMTKLRIRAATLVATPAFVEARIEMDESITAAAPRTVDPEAFADPGLDGPTAVTVTPEGRVFGHLATWGTCHIGIQGACVTAPRSKAGYGYFHTGAVATSDGGSLPVGQLTLGGGHADLRANSATAKAHYDQTGSAVADVRVGEDAFGIWVAGVVREGVPEGQVAELQAGALSGDWRTIDGSLELVAALAVNTPGFPIPRGMVASGETMALVAAGSVCIPCGDAPLASEDPAPVLDEVAAAREADRLAREMGADPASIQQRLAEEMGLVP